MVALISLLVLGALGRTTLGRRVGKTVPDDACGREACSPAEASYIATAVVSERDINERHKS